MDKILRCINTFIIIINFREETWQPPGPASGLGFPRIIQFDALIGWSDRVTGSAVFSVAESLAWFSVTSFRGLHTRSTALPTVTLLAVDSGFFVWVFSTSFNHYIWYISTHMTTGIFSIRLYKYTHHTHAHKGKTEGQC